MAWLRRVAVPLEQGVLHLSYAPEAFPKGPGRESVPFLELVDQLGKVLFSWDLMDDRGRTIPLCREALNDLPFTAVQAIHLALGADLAVYRSGRR